MVRNNMGSLVILLAGLVGCAPGVDVHVLRPAEIDLPIHVEKVVVADRAAPQSTGEHILSVIEGVLTAEGLFADKEARFAAIEEVAAVLDGSPRYEVVGILGEGDISTSIWDRDLSAAEAVNVCEIWGCDAIIALDAFDSDSNILDLADVVTAKPEERAEEVAEYIARRETTLLTSWEVYDGVDGVPLDAFREIDVGNAFDARGATWAEAVAGLPDGRSVVRGLGVAAASDYGSRIAPVWESVHRTFYADDAAVLEEAGEHAAARHFEAAVALWETGFDAADAELGAKCLYNAAVVAEYQGDLDGALLLARRAEARASLGRISRYAAELEVLAASWRPHDLR
jgi:hypothetical protein